LDGYIILSKENVYDLSLKRGKNNRFICGRYDGDVVDALLAAVFKEARNRDVMFLS
jgi:hypothetical protein